MKDFTVLVGKNNEGKSNFLTALNVAMNVLTRHGGIKRVGVSHRRSNSEYYEWCRDFPIQYQQRKIGLESIFKLEFRLEGDELSEFQRYTSIRGNEDIPIVIKIGKDNRATISVPKRGSSSYNNKSDLVAKFIASKLNFNYIQAVRTDQMAINVLRTVILQQVNALHENVEYNEAVNKIKELQQEILDQIASQLVEPLKTFLPQLNDIHITQEFDDFFYRGFRSDIEIIIDDGIPTNISYKGDGIKSLATLAILKDRKSPKGASIIAIEEPESHLHSGAIHNLVDVIRKISDNNQVIISTHNPLFVQQNNIRSNIIVNLGKAQSAKNIMEIREVLGVLPSDNLRNSSHVFVVEGETDKISLAKIISSKSSKLAEALASNKLVIKPLRGVGNLSHDILDLKNSMCKFFVLVDNDEEGRKAINKAIEKGLLTEADYKLTICRGSADSELEDCYNPNFYREKLYKKFLVDIQAKEFRNNKKWSVRMKETRLTSGSQWNDSIEKDIKMMISGLIPEKISNMDDILIKEKSGFIHATIEFLEKMLDT